MKTTIPTAMLLGTLLAAAPAGAASVSLLGNPGDSLGRALALGHPAGEAKLDLAVTTSRNGGGVFVVSVDSLGASDLLLEPGARGVGFVAQRGVAVEAVAFADLDGDGRDELIVGSPEDAGGRGSVTILPAHSFSGVPLVDLGSADVRALRIEGRDGDGLGRSLASGDFDHDGSIDLLAGAPAGDGGALVLYGRADLFAADPADVLAGASRIFPIVPGDGLGRAVSSGDLDGDGVSDALLGAPLADSGRGEIKVLFGGMRWSAEEPVAGDEAVRTLRVHGFLPGQSAGTSLAAADLDGDGDDELLIGAPGRTSLAEGSHLPGLVVTVDGSSWLGNSIDAAMPRPNVHRIESGWNGDASGWALAAIPGSEGNGARIFVGAPLFSNPVPSTGRVLTVVAPSKDTLKSRLGDAGDALFTTGAPNDRTGSAVAVATTGRHAGTAAIGIPNAMGTDGSWWAGRVEVVLPELRAESAAVVEGGR